MAHVAFGRHVCFANVPPFQAIPLWANPGTSPILSVRHTTSLWHSTLSQLDHESAVKTWFTVILKKLEAFLWFPIGFSNNKHILEVKFDVDHESAVKTWFRAIFKKLEAFLCFRKRFLHTKHILHIKSHVDHESGVRTWFRAIFKKLEAF